jgi:hypothetical protein
MTAFAVTAAIAAPAIVVAVIMTPAVMVMMMVMMVVVTMVIFAVTPTVTAVAAWSGVGSALRPRACRQAEQPHAQNQLMYFV